MDVINDLARNVVDVGYEDLPREAIDITKKFIIDTIGVGLAGTSVPGNAGILDLVREWGGKEESTILVYGIKTPSPEAAFINSLFKYISLVCSSKNKAFLS